MSTYLDYFVDKDGAFLRADALKCGWDDRALASAVRKGALTRLRRGAYAPTAGWAALSSEGRHRALGRVVLRAARCQSVLSHFSAAGEYDAPMWDVDLETVHLSRTDDKAGRNEAGVCQHHGWLGAEDVTRRNGVWVTTGTRTALDITTVTDTERALVVVDGLLRIGETTPALLARRLEQMTYWPHSLASDLVVRLADGRCQSAGESRTLYACWIQHLPRPEPQYEIWRQGRLVAQLDFAWPELGVWLEFDGKAKYTEHLRPGEEPADAVVREKKREDLIRRITGWVCVRITWADLYDPAAIARKVREAFATRARAA